MRMFEPAFGLWPKPQFLGGSPDGLSAWIVQRDTIEDLRLEQLRTDMVKHIIDTHHDRHARVIEPRR